MVSGVDVETRHERLDHASVYLLLTSINSAEFIGRRGLDPRNRVLAEESHDTFYIMSVPRGVEVVYHGHRVCHSWPTLSPPSLMRIATYTLSIAPIIHTYMIRMHYFLQNLLA